MNAYSLGLMFGATTLLFGCNDSNSDNAQSKIRVTHASADAPLVDIKLNGTTVDGLSLVDYQVGSGLISLDSGAYDVSVEALLAGDASAEVIGANLNFAPDMQYDIVALNYTADIEPVVLSRDDISPENDQVRIDVLHAHPNVPGVDIYLTTTDDIADQSPAISGLEFKVDSADLPVTIPAGTYRIRLTLSGDKGIAFDSGELDLAGGSDLMITAVPNVNGGAVSPVNLLVADGSAVNVLRSTEEKATVRVVHTVDDAPAVDVLASGSAVGGLTNIVFKEFRSLDLAPDSYDLSVAASADNSLVVIDAPGTSFEAGTTTSIYAVGKLNSVTDSTIEPLAISEDLRSVATYAKLRVVHASPTAETLGLVDIHASADGVFDETTAVLQGVAFKGTSTLNVPAGTYFLAVILASDASFTPAVSATATVDDGGVYSVVATDDFGGGLVLNVDNMAP
ncbi:DUF4397 domain-containing protein [Photobacterium lipolyticum]|uniref:DUF4397 domain-containing protein n=1 Tax=Photobacterium lipolyticum TaxID=266810 RepID=A0A2T3N3D8_9GAMM|nr:DUF4397 domain-containing protein [Photobacterium lipolyticum]PSW06785.1 DUF4397 domain-containing protein [Photobacterium lipolyticum]